MKYTNIISYEFFLHFFLICDKLVSILCEVKKMRLIMANITAAFWALILGEVLGYICGQLDILTISPVTMGILSIVMGLFAANAFSWITKSAEAPSK